MLDLPQIVGERRSSTVRNKVTIHRQNRPPSQILRRCRSELDRAIFVNWLERNVDLNQIGHFWTRIVRSGHETIQHRLKYFIRLAASRKPLRDVR